MSSIYIVKMKTVWSFLFRKQVRWHVPSHLTVSHAEIESILSVLGNLEMLPSVRLHAVMSRRPLWTKNCRIFGRPLFFFFFPAIWEIAAAFPHLCLTRLGFGITTEYSPNSLATYIPSFDNPLTCRASSLLFSSS